MNTVQRFFRRYIFSTVGIMILFLAVNIVLLFAIMIAGNMSGSDTSFSVSDFSDHIVFQGGSWAADDAALSMLQEQSAWAMLLRKTAMLSGSRICRKTFRAPIQVRKWLLSAAGIWRTIR